MIRVPGQRSRRGTKLAAAATGVRASAVERFTGDVAADAARGLYERHGGAVFRFCRSRLRSPEEAEDAGQTTFLYALRALGRGVVPISELSWLLKIAENVCRSRRQDAKRRFALEISEDPEQMGRLPAPAGAEPELLMPLEDALGRLTDQQRQALLLREWQGLSYREIAARLGIGQGAVEVLLFRARRALAEELETPGAVRRRRVRALDLGWLVGLAKQFVGGAVAAKTTLAVIAAGVVATVSAVGLAVDSEEPRPAEPRRSERSTPAAPAPAPRVVDVRGAAVTKSPAVARKPEGPRSVGGTRSTEPLVEPQPARGAPGPAPAPLRAPAPVAPSPASEPAPELPRLATVDEATAPVSSVLDPVVSTVESTAEPVVATVEGVVDDVVETAEAVVSEPVQQAEALLEPELPPAPQLP